MKHLGIFVIVSSISILTSCKLKKETLPMDNLMAAVDIQLLNYTQEYMKDSTGMYNLSATSSVFGMRLSGSFMEEKVSMQKDTLLPDQSKGYYNKIRYISPDTLEQTYKSPVAGQDMVSNLKCPITFEKGTALDLSSGKDVTLKYTDVGVAELKAMYTTQLEREFTPSITDLMWKEIERIHKDKFTSAELHERYRLNVIAKTEIVEMGNSSISMNGTSAKIIYDQRLYFNLKFIGKIEIIQ